MSLIKFPSHIKPSRVTVQLQRVDEIFASPLSNIQQVVSRGNPAWRWTYEFTNISQSEREVVQAFLMNCRGSLNTFKVSDPAGYSIGGTMSDWTDVYSDRGSVFTIPGSDTNNVNSWFKHATNIQPHINDDGSVNFEYRADATGPNLLFAGENQGGFQSLQSGWLYAMRAKHFAKEYCHYFFFSVQSNAYSNYRSENISSEGSFTFPFYTGEDPSNHYLSLYEVDVAPAVGKQFTIADWRLSRVVGVVNTENLLTYSNAFDMWSSVAVSVESGFANDPSGRNNYWRLYVNSDEATHYLTGNCSLPGSADTYTIDIYMKEGAAISKWALQMGDTTDYARAYVDLSVGSVYQTTQVGSMGGHVAKCWSASGGAYRVQLTSYCSSDQSIPFRVYAVNSDNSLDFQITTDPDSAYVDIFNASWRRGSVMGASHITSDTACVGSADDWTGSKIRLSGFDPETVIKAGTRFELINQYHSEDNDVYERSEFKRVTREVQVGMEGHALIEFDPPIRNSPKPIYQDNGQYQSEHTTLPIAIFTRPEMKARLLNGTIQYIEKPLQMMDVVFDVIEDLTE